MNNLFKKILRWKLKKLSQFTISRFRPGIVGVTGSVGKTSTKLAIEAVLKQGRRVRASRGNLNNDLGLPLAVLGDWNEAELGLVSRKQPPGTAKIKKLFFWFKVLLSSFFRLLFGSRFSYPEILVLEYGADRPGDLKYLLSIARPNISVITAVGDIPVHVEFFAGPEDVAREKARLIEHLPVAGFAVLNYDDETVMDLKDKTRAHIITFGFGKGAEIRITNFENRSEAGRPAGISFKLEYGGSFVPVRIENVFGRAQAYAAAAATAVGFVFGMNLVKISDALRLYYKPARSRMELVAGIKYSYIIDDSYNASPYSMHAAIDTLKSLPAKRKIAVLGDMLEIGKYTIEAHERVGRLVAKAKAADILITVGARAKLIAEAAKESGMRKNNIYSFDEAAESGSFLQNILRKGDLVLVKGSRAIGLDAMVEEVKAF